MDPIIISLAAKAVGVLMPYATMSAGEFVKTAGQAAYEKSKNLLQTLKSSWSGDKEATDTLENFEKKPERYQSVIEDILKEKLSQDKDFANDIQKLIKDIGPQLDIILKMKVGEKVVGLDADEMTGGKAKVQMDIEQAKDVTGARIKRIG